MDLAANTVTFVPEKKRSTGKEITLPLHPVLVAEIRELLKEQKDRTIGWLTPALEATPIGGKTGLSNVFQLLNESVSISGVATSTRWLPKSFTFVADSATTTLSFSRGLTVPMDKLLLDNIRVTNMTALDTVLATQTFTGAPGNCMVKLMAAEAALYRIERTSDLRNWVKIGEVVVLSPGPVEFRDADPVVPGQAARFYRIAYVMD